MSSKECKSCSVTRLAVLGAVISVLMFPVYRTVVVSQHPISYILPNLLLFTPFRETTKWLWHKLKYVDTMKVYEHQHVPVVSTFAELREATQDWRHPAIVRGLFKDVPAAEKWLDPEYFLNTPVGHYEVPVVRTALYNTMQNDRYSAGLGETYREIVGNPESLQYLFVPVLSRFKYNNSEMGSLRALRDGLNKVINEDLKVEEKLWKGFGSKDHKTYKDSQIIVGWGKNSTEQSTGTGWHCAIGNNYFVQVIGGKRWYFLDPKYSAMMSPVRGGLHHMMTSTLAMSRIHKHIPLQYADVQQGDLLYNPDWYWHTIVNKPGLSIGVPLREANFSLAFRNNFQFSSIVTMNKIFQALNIDIGGYSPATGNGKSLDEE